LSEARSRLSRLVARVEKGERITIVRKDRPVAQLVRVQRSNPSMIAPDDPLLNLDAFAVDGPGGKLSNADIDRTLARSRCKPTVSGR
ncbi:MAG TPA: type II toxin-antitoxin system prevent-host-death family antitoxin, partial [Opitutaceae bacterium]|nr:type II toxin-antitoxin system prevent-host-death family antitoxin [Opitutaceae bacterium]